MCRQSGLAKVTEPPLPATHHFPSQEYFVTHKLLPPPLDALSGTKCV